MDKALDGMIGMRRFGSALLGLLLLGALTVNAGGDGERTPQAPPEAGEAYEDAPATIRKVGNLGFGIDPDDYPGTRYAPDKLPEDFREDGLEVFFSGVVQEAPPGARMWGTPLKLTSIRRRDAEEPKNSASLVRSRTPECDKTGLRKDKRRQAGLAPDVRDTPVIRMPVLRKTRTIETRTTETGRRSAS